MRARFAKKNFVFNFNDWVGKKNSDFPSEQLGIMYTALPGNSVQCLFLPILREAIILERASRSARYIYLKKKLPLIYYNIIFLVMNIP